MGLSTFIVRAGWEIQYSVNKILPLPPPQKHHRSAFLANSFSMNKPPPSVRAQNNDQDGAKQIIEDLSFQKKCNTVKVG